MFLKRSFNFSTLSICLKEIVEKSGIFRLDYVVGKPAAGVKSSYLFHFWKKFKLHFL